MSNPWAYAIGALVLLTVGAGAMRGYDKAHATQARIDTLTVHQHTTDTLWRHDTLVFSRVIKVPLALHDTVVKHLADTILVKTYIAASDSALHACSAVFQSCKASIAIRDSIIDQYRKLKPSRISLGIQATCGVGLAARADCVLGIGGSWAIVR